MYKKCLLFKDISRHVKMLRFSLGRPLTYLIPNHAPYIRNTCPLASFTYQNFLTIFPTEVLTYQNQNQIQLAGSLS